MEEVNPRDYYRWFSLPLYPDPDYTYVTTIEQIAYRLRFCFNIREQTWFLDVRYANNDPIALGVALIPNYPVLIDHDTPFSGFFYLSSIGEEKNQTVQNPYEIWKYYELYYGGERVE